MSGVKALLLVIYLFTAPRSTLHASPAWLGREGNHGSRLLAGFSQCYRLNLCAPPPPPIRTLKTSPQCDGIWRWGLQEVIRP